MKDSYYFSHDSNALIDPKILEMRCDYGMEGYGVFWAVIEMLRNQEEYKQPLNMTTFKGLKMLCMTNINIEEFITKCINEYKLFESDGEYFWSASLCKRMNKKEKVSKERREASKRRWNKNDEKADSEQNESKNDTNSMQTECKPNANAMQTECKCNPKESKEKESKENKNKEKESKENNDCVVEKEKSLSPSRAKLVRFYTNNINSTPSPHEYEKLFCWEDTFDCGLMIRGLEIAAEKNRRFLSYVEGIYKRWENDGIHTLEQYEARERIREAEKQNNDKSEKGRTGNTFFDMLLGGEEADT